MNSQAEVTLLIEKLTTAVETVITTVEQLTAEQWQTEIAAEGGFVGMVTHHIAASIAPVMDWTMKVAHSQELPPFTREALHQYNANHAEKHASPDQSQTIALLHRQKEAAIQNLHSLSDEQLPQTLPFALANGREVSTQQMVEWFLINHCHNHLKSIKETMGLA